MVPQIASETLCKMSQSEVPKALTELKRQSLNGVAVTLVAQAVSTVVHLASTVILARMLTPADYGIVAMVTAITSFAGLFRDLGLSAAVVQKKDLTNGQQSNLFWLNVAMGASLTILFTICSPFVSWFYHKPELSGVTAALSMNFLIGSLGTQHGAMLAKRLHFGRRALANIVGGVAALVVAVYLAYSGLSYWALVGSSLSGGLCTTVLLFAFSPFRPGLPARGRDIREMLAFGAHITAFDVVNYFHRNLDNILIGRFWGAGALGMYSRAYSLLMFPIHAIRGPVNTVVFPLMSKLQDDPEAFREIYCKATCAVALASMPITAFLAVCAAPIIELALGSQWMEVQPIFAVLAIVGFIQPTVTLWGLLLQSRGLGRAYLQLGILNTLVTTVGFVAGLPWGAIGVASGYAIVTYLSAIPFLKYAYQGTSIRVSDFLSNTYRPCVASILASSFGMLQVLFLPGTTAWTSLLYTSVVFSSTFYLTMLVLPGGAADLHMLTVALRPLMRRVSPLLRFARP